ncbi:MAG: hypothetical protein AAF066_10780, partial [Pseudomonadota bacterium]
MPLLDPATCQRRSNLRLHDVRRGGGAGILGGAGVFGGTAIGGGGFSIIYATSCSRVNATPAGKTDDALPA